MNTTLPETTDACVALLLQGKLDESDYEAIVPQLERRIAAHGKISLYWEMENFDGWTPKALWADTKFDWKHHDHFERIAIVGEKKWHETMTNAMKPFTSAEVRYFEPADRQAALDWAREGD